MRPPLPASPLPPQGTPQGPPRPRIFRAFGVGAVDAAAYAAQGLAAPPALPCVEASVAHVAACLAGAAGLTDAPFGGRPVGPWVTHTFVAELFSAAAARLRALGGGLFVAYFCGHGLRRWHPAALDETVEALCLHDGLFDDLALSRSLAEFSASDDVVLLVDACYAAGLAALDRAAAPKAAAAVLLLGAASEVGATRCEGELSVFAGALGRALRSPPQTYAALAEALHADVALRNESVELVALSEAGARLLEAPAFA